MAVKQKEASMNQTKGALLIGGTGLLGYHAGLEFLQKGYNITVMALDKPANLFPTDVEYLLGDVAEMKDSVLLSQFEKHQFVLIACGVDDRVTPPAPALPFFRKHNVELTNRLVQLAKQAGVSKVVVLGSYFTHFNREFPELEMAKHHPYITSRVEQQEVALAHADSSFSVVVLELPYIFGTVPGRKPLWNVLLDQINAHKTVFYTKGGTTMVTAKQVGQAIVGAFEHAKTGAYLVAGKNLLWTEWLALVLKALNQEGRKVVIVPKWVVKLALKSKMRKDKKEGKESGLNMVKYVDFQTRCSFGDAKKSMQELHFEHDDLETAILHTIKKCVE